MQEKVIQETNKIIKDLAYYAQQIREAGGAENDLLAQFEAEAANLQPVTTIKGAIRALCKFQTYFSFAFQAAFQAPSLQNDEAVVGAQLVSLRESLVVLQTENQLLQEANAHLETALKRFSALPILGDKMKSSIFEVIDVIKQIKGLHADVLMPGNECSDDRQSAERLA